MSDSGDFKYDVFLSHSSADKPVVRDVAERLRKDGLRVWFDDWELKAGDSIPAKIEEGLEQSRVLVLCMSANAFGSDWAKLESYTFRFRDPLNKERRFIPLRLDDAPIKGSLAQFLYINWLTPVREEEYSKLLEACRNSAPVIEIQAQSESGWNRARPAEVVIDRDLRHDFSKRTRDTLAKRVAMLCSNPACQRPTSGPQSDPNKVVNIGVAAHIAAASARGPRYDSSQSKHERSSIDNGIWLCQNCAKLIDSDENRFPGKLLREWKDKAETKAHHSIQSTSPLISTSPESQLRVRGTYAGGKSGTQASINIFNAGTSPIYLSAWYSEWGDQSANMSLECVRGELPFRLQAQDMLTLVVDLGDRGFTDLRKLGVVDGSNNHSNVGETEIAIMVQQAERYSVLHKKPDTTELEARLRECKVDVRPEITTAPHGIKTLVINFTNKSDIPIPLIGARIEWEYDPPRTLPRGPDGIGSVSEVRGSVNLACRTDLSSPVPPGATVQFYVHPNMAGVLVETMLGDVKDKDIAITFGTTTPFGWKANEDEIPGTIREFAQHVVDSRRNDENTSQSSVPQSDPEPSVEVERIVPTSPREELGNPNGYEDGTNVPRGTPFLVVASVTEHWYRPNESKCPSDWKPRWKRLNPGSKNSLISAVRSSAHFSKNGFRSFPKFSDYSDAHPYGRELIQSGGGLHLEPSPLYSPDRSPLFGDFPIHDVNGRPISNSAGQAFGFRFGLCRQFFLSVEQADLRESLTMPGPRIFELATDGAAILYQLPSNVAISLWQNWRLGFSRRESAAGYLWLDSLFELARQRSPGDALYSRPEAWSGNTSIALVGQGLFPRLPKIPHFPGLISVPEDNGYPVAWRSTLHDIARASVIAIDELLERAR